MYPIAKMSGGSSAFFIKRYKIGNTVVRGQVVVSDPNLNAAPVADIVSPTSVTSYAGTIGVVAGVASPDPLSTTTALTYTTVAGTGDSSADRIVEVICIAPDTIYQGPAAGGATGTSGTLSPIAKASNGNWLVDTGTSKTVISDTNIGTTVWVGGFVIGFTGKNAGKWRRITSQINSTSITVTVPFDYAPVALDEFVVFPGSLDAKGLQLTTDFTAFNIAPGAGNTAPFTGNSVMVDFLTQFNPGGTPQIFLNVVFPDSLFITN